MMEDNVQDEFDYSFEGYRELILCSFDRLEAFTLAAQELESTKHFTVKAYSWIPSNKVYIADVEGAVSCYEVNHE